MWRPPEGRPGAPRFAVPSCASPRPVHAPPPSWRAAPRSAEPLEPANTAASRRTIRFAIPAYNEAASIEDLIARIGEVSREQRWNCEIVIVDDGSADGTGDLARASTSSCAVVVLRNEPNQGLERTIRRALREAAERSAPGDVIVTLDADLTQVLGYVPSMLAKLHEGYDVVIASRYQSGSAVERAVHVLLDAVLRRRARAGFAGAACPRRAHVLAASAPIVPRSSPKDSSATVTTSASESGFGCMVEIAERLRPFASFAEVPFVLHYGASARSPRSRSCRRSAPTSSRSEGGQGSARGRARHHLGARFLRHRAGCRRPVHAAPGCRRPGGQAFLATLSDAITRSEVITGLALYALSSVAWIGGRCLGWNSPSPTR